MKKTFSLVLAILMIFALFGCAASGDTTESAAPETTVEATETATPTQETLDIVYLCASFTIQWCKDIATTLESLEDSLNFKLTSGDAQNDNEAYVTLVETYCDAQVDGFILNARPDINQRLYEIIEEAGIPVIFESNRIADADGNYLTSGVELDAYDCGAGCSTWVAENYESLGFDFSDETTVGFIGITMSSAPSFVNRFNGATETFAAAFPDANLFTADLVNQGENSAEAAYTEVATILGANPTIESWVIVGVLDDWGQGAARAVEDASLEDKTILVSVGGEVLTVEWDGGYEGCWVMCNYFNVMDYSKLLAPAICSVARGETTVEDLWPDWTVDGSSFSSVKISGEAATIDTYEAIRTEHTSVD